ncbi:MAG: hypothetical protein WDW38_009645 [Sanguina aurantia]
MLAQTTTSFVHDTTPLAHAADLEGEGYKRRTLNFISHGECCEAWLYTPTHAVGEHQTSLPPVIILGHGLGSQKDMGLHDFAEKFVQAGIAVFVFDYRCFGGSGGLPRHKIRWQTYLEDWEAALGFVTGPGGEMSQTVDSGRLALWGTSYSGGHVLMMAARHPSLVKAVVANEPFLSSRGQLARAVRERGIGTVAVMLGTAVVDQVRQSLGMSPLYVKMIGGRDELSLLQLGEEELSHMTRPTPRRQVGTPFASMNLSDMDPPRIKTTPVREHTPGSSNDSSNGSSPDLSVETSSSDAGGHSSLSWRSADLACSSGSDHHSPSTATASQTSRQRRHMDTLHLGTDARSPPTTTAAHHTEVGVVTQAVTALHLQGSHGSVHSAALLSKHLASERCSADVPLVQSRSSASNSATQASAAVHALAKATIAATARCSAERTRVSSSHPSQRTSMVSASHSTSDPAVHPHRCSSAVRARRSGFECPHIERPTQGPRPLQAQAQLTYQQWRDGTGHTMPAADRLSNLQGRRRRPVQESQRASSSGNSSSSTCSSSRSTSVLTFPRARRQEDDGQDMWQFPVRSVMGLDTKHLWQARDEIQSQDSSGSDAGSGSSSPEVLRRQQRRRGMEISDPSLYRSEQCYCQDPKLKMKGDSWISSVLFRAFGVCV